MTLQFTGERIVPGAGNCEPTLARKMYQEHIARYEFAAAFVKGADVLDVGCGVGYGSHHLALSGAKSVLAFDVAADAVAHARDGFAHPVIRYDVFSATELDIKSSFDVIVCFEMIEHINEQEEVLDNIAAALRENGILLISTPRPHADMRSEYHVHELDLDSFQKLLGRRFSSVAPYFEGNYFTSFIGRNAPKSIEKIVTLTKRFGIETADYYLFVATNERSNLESIAKPVLTMEDDDYVRNLERDVHILHDAEDNAKKRIEDLEEVQKSLQSELEITTRTTPEERTHFLIKLAQVADALAESETEVARRRDEVETLVMLSQRLRETASSARELLRQRTEALRVMETRARSAEASHAHELGQATMLHRVLKEHSDALIAHMERADRAEALHEHELAQASLLHKELEKHSDALVAAMNHIGQVEAELAKLPVLNDALRAALDRATIAEASSSLVPERDAEIVNLRDKAETARRAADESDRKAADLRREVEAMRESIAWRLGAPLRRFYPNRIRLDGSDR